VLNNYQDVEYSAIKDWIEAECDYGCIGKEVGDSGTPHLQGYFRKKTKCRLSQLKTGVSQRAHFEVARGSPRDNRTYCSKDGDFWEFGTCPAATGRKSRDELALEFRSAFDSGNIVKFAEDNPGAYAFSGHVLLRNCLGLAVAVERPDVTVEWLYGEPGVGKSRLAHGRFPQGFVKEPRTKWWTGYKLERDVIIDDIAPKGIDINHLLRWFDRYKCYVETKGDMVPLHAVNFIVTSNFSPDDCFRDEDGGLHKQMPALRRRMTVTHMSVPFAR